MPNGKQTLPIIKLVDRHENLVSAWRNQFSSYDGVDIYLDDFFAHPADAMVSPANSFGIMDGGLDLAIRNDLRFQVERSVRRLILAKHHGELPVGSAEVVETGHVNWPFLIVAPTMRVPEPVGRTLNPYLASRAALLAVEHFNATATAPIRTLLCPGLGTGIGGVKPHRCAVQMRLALKHVADPARIASFQSILAVHTALSQA